MRFVTVFLAAALAMCADLSLTVPEPALSVGFSRDGTTVVAVCQDGVVRWWDVRTGGAKRSVTLSKSRLRIATQSDDGMRAATADRSGEIRVWDLEHGELLKVLAGVDPRASDKRLDALQFSPDGKRLAAAGRERRVRIFDVATGREAMSLPDGVGEDATVVFSRDAGLVAAPNSDTNTRVWDARTGKQIATIDRLPLSLFALTFSADGHRLVGAGVDRSIYIWNTATWQVEQKLEGQTEMILALALSADGRKLVAGGNSELSVMNPVKVLIWDVAAAKVLMTLDSPHTVIAAAVSPDGSHVAGATAGNVVKVWQIDSRP